MTWSAYGPAVGSLAAREQLIELSYGSIQLSRFYG
jgi:hypothetical protein